MCRILDPRAEKILAGSGNDIRRFDLYVQFSLSSNFTLPD